MMKYPKIIGWSVVIGMWSITSCALEQMKNSALHHTDECSDCQEVFNTAEDMIGWIEHDLEAGKIDSSTADTDIDNLEGIIIGLGVTR